MRLRGIVNLPRLKRHDRRSADQSKSSRRILGEFGEFAPCNESRGELLAMLEEAFGSGFVALFLQQDIEFSATLVDRTPQQIRLGGKSTLI